MRMRSCLLALLSAAVMLVPARMSAQGPRPGGGAWWESAWWNSPLVRTLDLSEAQTKDIRSTVQEYRGHLLELREAVRRADGDLEALMTTSPVDQRKASDAIDRLANARGELTRTLSQMTLRLRGILTNEQWQELQQRASERGGPGGRLGRGRGPLGGETFKRGETFKQR